MRAVKLFNVVAGILLIGGTLVLVASLIFRKTSDEPVASQSVIPQAPLSSALEAIWLDARPGSRIVASELAREHALITTEDADGARQVFVVHLATGTVSEIRTDRP